MGTSDPEGPPRDEHGPAPRDHAPLVLNRANSEAAWDDRYRRGGHWDTIKGEAITERFAECLFQSLPMHLKRRLDAGHASILDWGCGRGQMTAAMRQEWPACQVVGMDISATAIEEARRRYGRDFRHIPDGRIVGEWDVIVASHIYEHLTEPFEVLSDHLANHAKALYIILTPFDEDLGPEATAMATAAERGEAGYPHVQRYVMYDFPRRPVPGWKLIVEQLTATPGPVWEGEQLLVVYAPSS